MPSNLDDLDRYGEADPQEMRRFIAEFPAQCEAAWKLAMARPLPASYRNPAQIVVVGMGGSAIGADLVRGLLDDQLPVPMQVVRGYDLPAYVGPESLVIVCSHSGNTEETLAAFARAQECGARLAAVTTGGTLAGQVRAKGLPLIAYTSPAQPRAALGYSLVTLLALLRRLDLTADLGDDLQAAIQQLSIWGEHCRPETPEPANPAKRLARKLAGATPVIYGALWLTTVAYRWRCQINENAKQWAFSGSLPELNHNAVVGYDFPAALPSPYVVLFLDSARYPPALRRRAAATQHLLSEKGVPWAVVEAEGASRLAEMLQAIHLSDWTSYYLALLNGTDPTPVRAIDQLKAELALHHRGTGMTWPPSPPAQPGTTGEGNYTPSQG